ncbi:MAG: hypothetical protein J6Z01_01655 [Bacteroidales bacterium]|nr:hypothetical protein [Bacteroidales bacterium]
MKHTALTFIAAIILILTSCAVKNADDTGIFFYNMIKINDFDQAVTVIDPEALKRTPLEVWKNGLEQKENRMGQLLSYQRTNYYTDTIDNVTRVSIEYDVRYAEGKLEEKLQFICREGKFFITFYEFTEKTE